MTVRAASASTRTSQTLMWLDVVQIASLVLPRPSPPSPCSPQSLLLLNPPTCLLKPQLHYQLYHQHLDHQAYQLQFPSLNLPSYLHLFLPQHQNQPIDRLYFPPVLLHQSRHPFQPTDRQQRLSNPLRPNHPPRLQMSQLYTQLLFLLCQL